MSDIVEQRYNKDRNPMELEPWFSKHMSSMTSEDLHSKADIAQELATRDQQIESLRQQLADKDEINAEWVNNLAQQLAECQARLIKTAVFPIDKTLLDNLIKQATHESVLRVIAEWEKPYGLTDGTPFIDRLRRMAKELE